MFRFSLEALLLRRRAVEGSLRARYDASARASARALGARRGLDAALLAAYACPTRAGDLAYVDAAAREQTGRVERGRVVCDRLREALIEAGRARVALERLRERRLAEYRCERRRRDERELDEANRAGYVERSP